MDGLSNWKELLVFATAAVGLLGAALPQLAKSLDAYSASARGRRQLQRIQDLTDVVSKIKNNSLLSPELIDAVSSQVYAEITATVAEMRCQRERREKEARATETIRAHDVELAGSALPTWRRILLLYKPHGVIAWVAHPIFFLYAVTTVTLGLSPEMRQGAVDALWGTAVLMIAAWLAAWFARRRWEKRQRLLESTAPAPEGPASTSIRTAAPAGARAQSNA